MPHSGSLFPPLLFGCSWAHMAPDEVRSGNLCQRWAQGPACQSWPGHTEDTPFPFVHPSWREHAALVCMPKPQVLDSHVEQQPRPRRHGRSSRRSAGPHGGFDATGQELHRLTQTALAGRTAPTTLGFRGRAHNQQRVCVCGPMRDHRQNANACASVAGYASCRPGRASCGNAPRERGSAGASRQAPAAAAAAAARPPDVQADGRVPVAGSSATSAEHIVASRRRAADLLAAAGIPPGRRPS